MNLLPDVLALGLFTGWLVNYAADLLPSSGFRTRPPCWNCQTAVPWKVYLLFAPCPGCGSPRRVRTYVLQFAIPASILYLWRVSAGQLQFPWSVLLLSYLVLMAVIDIEHHVILHVTSVAGALLGFGLGVHLHGVQPTVIGGFAGYCIMLVLYVAGVAYARGRTLRCAQALDEAALGYGDVYFAGVAGLLVGWPGVLLGLLIALLSAGLISLLILARMLLRRQYRALAAIPYAPFLGLSVVILLLRP